MCMLGEMGGDVCRPNSRSIYHLLSAFLLLLRSMLLSHHLDLHVDVLEEQTAVRNATCLLLSVLILRINTELKWRQPHSV